ncbi:phytanoyl-CoA dioxygenase domain-containing protein 1 homolog [Bradysia coprophila]|uniref:phytanoyl-CoA dioxygenase domain-containing protein 1 homolog n=1 Tax=Bradysia coprophila TaxID=38358 RepID=UPI00187DC3CA|nr:phytanoyl-CoA dioxygenase domain-containing protein 1 homolog [Bradysia coprophila]
MSNYSLDQYDVNGFAVVENFLTEQEADELRQAGLQVCRDAPDDDRKVFGLHSKEDYYLESANKLHYFYESEALDKDGNLLVDKMESINKIGHGCHLVNPIFHKYTFDDRVKKVAKKLGLKKPAVMQSMFIYKNPKIGGYVKQHQDSMYLLTDPINVTAFWIPTEDATLENGCVWFVKGSHKNGLLNRFVRNPVPGRGDLCVYEKPDLNLPKEQYIPCPVKKGSLVVFDGLTIHQSDINRSDKSRYAYTFHVMETEGTKFLPENWIRLPEGEKFERLY